MSRLFRAAKAAAEAVRSLTGNPPETEEGPYTRSTAGRSGTRPLLAQRALRNVAERITSLIARRREPQLVIEGVPVPPPSQRGADWRPGAPPVDIDWMREQMRRELGIEKRAGAPPVDLDWMREAMRRAAAAPPPITPPAAPSPPAPPAPTPPKPAEIPPEEPESLFGRGMPYTPEMFADAMANMRLTPNSSNVYGYFYEYESRTRGILYVTFLGDDGNGERSGPGQTYAYYDVPVRKYQEFSRASAESAGGAVWDYLRVRGTVWRHQHNYRLIQSHGDYVPRKATRLGFKTRSVARMGGEGPFRQGEFTPVGERARAIRRSYTRSTLPERTFLNPPGSEPNRGEPDRGSPNRGR